MRVYMCARGCEAGADRCHTRQRQRTGRSAPPPADAARDEPRAVAAAPARA